MVTAQGSLIIELEEAIQSGSADRRVDTLRRVTDLFLGESERLSEEQISVFDDVLGLLIQRVETKALAELSARLAPVDTAPIEVVKSLAFNDEVAVASPVLTSSPRLTDEDLIAVAQTKGQGHLLAISGRATLNECVTDVLVDRGEREVFHKLASNAGARFSGNGFATLVKKSETDDDLAEKVGSRLDIPLRLFRELLMRATEAVRNRLLAIASPEMQEEIQRVIATISSAIGREGPRARSYRMAHALVLAMKDRKELTEEAVVKFATSQKAEELTAAITVLCSAPLELMINMMESLRNDVLLVPCKAANFQWSTVETILKNRHANVPISGQILDLAKRDYLALSTASAQRTVRFWQVRATTTKEEG
jgi:uncharacterized protein (DUF2336 family)